MKSTVLRCSTGGHYKEYRIDLDGHNVRLFWGKIGATMQSQTKVFPTVGHARRFAEDKTQEKLDKDYYVFRVEQPLTDYEIPPQFRKDIELMRLIESSLR